MTQRVLRYLVGFTGLLFLVIGLGLLLAPGRQAAMFAVLPSGSAGLSTVRADLAGLFLGIGAFALAGSVGASIRLLAVPAALLGFIAFGRLVSLLADGPSPDALRSLGVELVAAMLLVLTIASLKRNQPARLFAAFVLPALVVLGLGTGYLFQRELGMTLFRRFVDQGLHSVVDSQSPRGMTVGGERRVQLIEDRIHRRVERILAVQDGDLHLSSAASVPSMALVCR